MKKQRTRLVKQLIKVLNNPDMDRDIQEELDLVLTPIHLHQLNKDQKNEVTRLHDFLYKWYDGETEKTVVMYQLILSVIRSLKPSFPVQYELKFWVNKILTADQKNHDMMFWLTRGALKAKMAWPVEADHSWTGNNDIPSSLYLEEQLMTLHSWLQQDQGYDVDDPTDQSKLCKYVQTVLSAL